MLLEQSHWETKAADKRASTHAKIPKDWLLDKATLRKASAERDITGPFIEDCLSSDEKALTKLPASALLLKIGDGTYSAVEVTRAFCKRTAIAQQLVGHTRGPFIQPCVCTNRWRPMDLKQVHRTTACTKFFSIKRNLGLWNSIATLRSIKPR